MFNCQTISNCIAIANAKLVKIGQLFISMRILSFHQQVWTVCSTTTIASTAMIVAKVLIFNGNCRLFIIMNSWLHLVFILRRFQNQWIWKCSRDANFCNNNNDSIWFGWSVQCALSLCQANGRQWCENCSAIIPAFDRRHRGSEWDSQIWKENVVLRTNIKRNCEMNRNYGLHNKSTDTAQG